MRDHTKHGASLGARDALPLATIERSRDVGFAEKAPCEGAAHKTEHGGADARARVSPQHHEERAERRPHDGARGGRGAQPTESLGTVLGIAGVGDVRLEHAHRSSAHALNDAR